MIFFDFLLGLGFETQGFLALAKQMLYWLSHPSVQSWWSQNTDLVRTCSCFREKMTSSLARFLPIIQLQCSPNARILLIHPWAEDNHCIPFLEGPHCKLASPFRSGLSWRPLWCLLKSFWSLTAPCGFFYQSNYHIGLATADSLFWSLLYFLLQGENGWVPLFWGLVSLEIH